MYSYRWAIECTFENCKQFLGLEDPANRLPKAVERTAPMALIVYSLVIVWFHQTGHRFVRFPIRPWYQRKQEPSFADLLTTLRRVSLQEKTREQCFRTSVAQKPGSRRSPIFSAEWRDPRGPGSFKLHPLRHAQPSATKMQARPITKRPQNVRNLN